MRNLVTLLLLFLTPYSFAQNFEKIKQADTIYIYFKEDKINQIHHIEKGKTKTYDNYFFIIRINNYLFSFGIFKLCFLKKKLKEKLFLKKTRALS